MTIDHPGIFYIINAIDLNFTAYYGKASKDLEKVNYTPNSLLLPHMKKANRTNHILSEIFFIQKQPNIGVLIKRYSQNM